MLCICNLTVYHEYFYWRSSEETDSTGSVTRAIQKHFATRSKYGKGVTHISGFSLEVFGNLRGVFRNLRKMVKNVFARISFYNEQNNTPADCRYSISLFVFGCISNLPYSRDSELKTRREIPYLCVPIILYFMHNFPPLLNCAPVYFSPNWRH